MTDQYDATVQFHTVNPSIITLFDDYQFGILSITNPQLQLSTEPITILFSLDRSASMSDMCNDGRTKMQHIKHTTVNMLRHFSKMTEANIFVSIITFDDDIQREFDFVKIDNANVDELVHMVERIYPNGSTNIELALEHAKTCLIAEKFAGHRLHHIMLTDGEATTGMRDPNGLVELVPNCLNTFVGFGVYHDTKLLMKLSGTHVNNEYRVIDKIEHSGLVYGEIVHAILYPSVDNASVSLENGEIYDWRNNIWTDYLNIGQISCETEKIFHIRSKIPATLCGEFRGSSCLLKMDGLLDDISILPQLLDEMGLIEPTDLTPYVLRQRTQELLFESLQYNMTSNYDRITREKIRDKAKLNIELAKKLGDFYKLMKTYYDENVGQLSQKMAKLVKVLLDDIYIAERTLGRDDGAMYTNSRQSSQGRQQTYTVNNVEDDSRWATDQDCGQTPPAIRRTNTCSSDDILPPPPQFHNRGLRNHFNIIGHIMSDNIDSPYSTPGINDTMRSLTQDSEHENSESDYLLVASIANISENDFERANTTSI
jgi:uncharacterized protein YegL